jgi:hypothetical protein
MARQKKQLSTLQLEYQHQLNRIKQAVRRAEKRGYVFDENTIPKTPQRITSRSVSKLQKIKPVDLYKKSVKFNEETGETIKGTKARKLERKESAKKAQETRRYHKLEKEQLDLNRENARQHQREQDEDFEEQTGHADYEQDANYFPEPEDSYDDYHYEEYEGYEDYGNSDQLPEPQPEQITTDIGYTIDPETGEIITEPEPVHEREKYNKLHGLDKYKPKTKADFTQEEYDNFPTSTDMIITQFRADIAHFPEVAEPMLGAWLNRVISKEGEDNTAIMLENAKADGVWIDYTIAYKRDSLIGMIADMLEYLPDVTPQFRKDLTEAFEFSEDWQNPD